ncbi:MAG TPA: glycosyltransferase family 2 protein [Methylomirabilota bacterium]|nr:glycosyltransferase family 2 protein [Methylomirabilota bacterium]
MPTLCPSPPAVSALIVNYNTAVLTGNSVSSLRAQTVRNPVSGAEGVEVIVVDNASRPDERCILGGLDAVVVFNDENRGYGAALNQALARARGEFLLFSNADTWYFPDALQTLLDHLQLLPRCGAVGPRLWWDLEREFLLPPSDPVTPVSFLRDILVRRSPFWLRYWAKRWRRLALAYWCAREPMEQPLLSGACLLTRRDVVAVCGGFDERFHLYYEDTDWCRRVRSKGYRLYYAPEAEVAHLYNQSARQATEAARQAAAASVEHYFRKHYGAWPWKVVSWVTTRVWSRTFQADITEDYVDLGRLTAPPSCSAPEKERKLYLLQLSPQPSCLPAIARFLAAPQFTLSERVWKQLAEGEFFAKLLSLPDLQLQGQWRWRKEKTKTAEPRP